MANNYQISLGAQISQAGIRQVSEQIKAISQRYKLNLDINMNDKVAAQIAGIQKTIVSLQQQAGAAISGNADKTIAYANAQGRLYKLISASKIDLGKQVQITQVLNKETGSLETRIIKTTDAHKKTTLELEKQIALFKQATMEKIKQQQIQYGANWTSGNTYAVQSKLDALTVENFADAHKEVNLELQKQTNIARELRKETQLTANATDDWISTLTKDFGKFTAWLVVAKVIYGAINSLKDGIKYVTELDSALNELKKVSNSTAIELKNVTTQAFDLGKQVAHTGTEVVKVTTDFVKMGYSMQESLNLAKYAMILVNVGENIKNVDEASSAIIATLKGFNFTAEETEHIVDALSAVANKYAVDTADLVYGIKVLSATLAQSNTSFEETLALLTAATEVLQDSEKAAYGINMISQRLRGLDEEGNNVANLLPKLQNEFKQIAKVSLVDSSGQLRSTYDILLDVSKIWPTLTQNQQQYLAELAAGNRQVKVFNALMSNSKTLLDATNVGLNSVGSAAQKNAVYLESITGKTQQFSSAVQQMWSNTISSDTIKAFVDLGTILIRIIDNVGLLKIAFIAAAVALVTLNKGIQEFISAKIVPAISAMIMRMQGLTIATEATTLAARGLTAALTFGLILIIPTVIELVDNLIHAQEKESQRIQENIEKYNQQQSAIESLISTYKQNAELANQNAEAKNALIDVESELYLMFGESAKNIDLETGAIDENIRKIRELSKEKAKEFLEENKYIAEYNKRELEKKSYSKPWYKVGKGVFSPFPDDVTRKQNIIEYIESLKALRRAITNTDIGALSRTAYGITTEKDKKKAIEDLNEKITKTENIYKGLHDIIVQVEEALKRLGIVEEKQPPPIFKPETYKTADEINQEVNELIDGLNDLSSAYETLSSGEQLSTEALIGLIQKYPEIAQYLAMTNDLTLKKGQLLKEVANIQIKTAISELEAEKKKQAGLMQSYSQQAQGLRNVIAMNVSLNAVLGGQLASAEEAARIAGNTMLAIDAQIKALSGGLDSLFSGGGSKSSSKSNTDKLKAQLDLEQEIYRAIIDTYNRELEAAKEAYEAKIAFLEDEKEKVLALKEAYDDEYESEQKRNELDELYKKRANLILAGQQDSASLVTLEQQIRDKEKAMQKEAIDTRFNKQVNYIDNMLEETKDAFEEIQNQYDKLLKDTETIWKRVAEIMKGGTQNIISFLEGNLEEFLSASPNEQAQMIRDWLKLIQTSGTGTNNIASLISSNLKKGNRGEEVKVLQRALNELGYRAGTIDGIFGSNTQSALKKFQKAMGVAQSGVLDEETKKKFKLVGYREGGIFQNDGIPYLHKGERILTAEQTKSFDLLVHNLTSVYSPLKNLLDFFRFPQVNTPNKNAGNTNVKVIFEGARFDTPENARKTTQEIKNTMNEIFKDMNRKGGLQNNVIIRR